MDAERKNKLAKIFIIRACVLLGISPAPVLSAAEKEKKRKFRYYKRVEFIFDTQNYQADIEDGPLDSDIIHLFNGIEDKNAGHKN